jgi:hypothetical protein
MISTSDDGDSYISTVKLPDLIRGWILGVRAGSAADSEQENHAWDCIQKVYSFLGSLPILNAASAKALNVDEDLLISLGVLLHDLTRSVHLAYEVVDANVDIHSAGPRALLMQKRNPRAPEVLVPLPGEKILGERMVVDGWCPSDVYRASAQTMIPSTLYFMSMFDRPKPQLRHDGCTVMSCKHWKVDERRYTTKHATEGCDCQNVAIPLKDIEEILSSDSSVIPLVTLHHTDVGTDGQLHVKLEPSSAEKKYVAISHVWSDGLGNPTSNEIPLCQFRRLSDMVENAWGDAHVYFWFDTLCFPYPASADKLAYKQAMERMRITYERADLVLVLDSYLLARDHTATTQQELVLRISCSGWSCRLWTFQEYQLAKRVMFQCKSGAVELPFALLELPQWTTDYIFEDIKSTRIVTPRSLIPIWSKPTELDMTGLYKAVGFRATSVAEDEAFCLANLLDLHSEEFMQAPPEDRMGILWQNIQPETAFQVLFWPCQRLKQDGLRWAPKSLMSRHYVRASLTPAGHTRGTIQDGRFVPSGLSRLVKVTPRGISFHCNGVTLSGFTGRPMASRFIFKGGRHWYTVEAKSDAQGRAVADGGHLPTPSDPVFPFRGMLVLLSPHLFNDQSLDTPSSGVAIVCSLKLPANSREPREAAEEHGWQHHALYELQLWCIAMVQRMDVKTAQVEELTTPAPASGLDPTWRFRERIENVNGQEAVLGTWGRYVCNPEDEKRIRSEMGRMSTPKIFPPQKLLVGEVAARDNVYFMR